MCDGSTIRKTIVCSLVLWQGVLPSEGRLLNV
jgi:hypothetical protein